MQTFKERSKELDYSNLNYPFADKGPKKMRRLQNTIFLTIIFKLLNVIFIYIGDHLKANPVVKNPQPAMTDSPDFVQKVFGLDYKSLGLTDGGIDGLLKNLGKNVSYFLGHTFNVVYIILIIAIIILLIDYLWNVKKRAHEFERNIIKNDIQAVGLYRKIQNSLQIGKRLSEAKRAIKPKSGGASEPPSADNLAKVEELKAMRKMDIRVNTRQKLTSDKINTIYSIYIQLPLDETVAMNLLKRIETLNETFTRLARGLVTMGGYQITKDRQTVVFQGETPDIADPYNFTELLDGLGDENVEIVYYESAYPLSKLVDQQATIDQKKELAFEWAQRTGEMLDRFLITAKMKVTRLNTNVSSSKATYVYDLALDSNLSSGFNKFDEAIDKTFKLKGSSVNIVNGHLEIILPIPKEYHIPINVPTLYREAFGIVEEEKDDEQ